MKAIYFDAPGPPEVLQYGELPDPTLNPDQVLVAIKAVSLNPIDTYIRQGANYWTLPKPFIPGCDFAGVIQEVGANVRSWRVGQRVWGSNQGLLGRQGTFAELAAVDVDWLYPTPDSVSDEQAAACSLVGITAHLGLFREAKIQPGETIFVRGGTGGVGAMVLQMAKCIGAVVIASAGSPQRADRCRELGADVVIQYKTQDVGQIIQEVAPRGVHVFWETLRTPDFDFAVTHLAERGRMVLMAGRDARPAFPVGPFYVKGCSLHGFAMFKATAPEQHSAASDMNHWFHSGRLRAQIDRVLPLASAAEAHRIQEQSTLHQDGSLAGKIVLRV